MAMNPRKVMNVDKRKINAEGGVTLVEVLIAIIVLSIGLLGLAALQANSLKFNHSAYLRSQATHLAYSITDQMRADRLGALDGDYDIDIGDSPTGTDVPGNALTAWKNDLAARLPQGDGSVCRSSDGQACGTGSVFIVTIRWDDSRGENAAQEFRYVTAL